MGAACPCGVDDTKQSAGTGTAKRSSKENGLTGKTKKKKKVETKKVETKRSEPPSRREKEDDTGSCFTGASIVSMADGSTQLVDSIKPGDMVRTGLCGDEITKVHLVLQIPIPRGQADLVQLSPGLLLSGWHPVRLNGNWTFPAQQAKQHRQPCDMMYNFVLSEHHVMWIGDIACVTLGHGMEGDVVGHSFLGSHERVCSSLSALPGFDSRVLSVAAVRSQNTDLLCGFKPAPCQSIAI